MLLYTEKQVIEKRQGFEDRIVGLEAELAYYKAELLKSTNHADELRAELAKYECECENGKIWRDDRRLSFTPCPIHLPEPKKGCE